MTPRLPLSSDPPKKKMKRVGGKSQQNQAMSRSHISSQGSKTVHCFSEKESGGQSGLVEGGGGEESRGCSWWVWHGQWTHPADIGGCCALVLPRHRFWSASWVGKDLRPTVTL